MKNVVKRVKGLTVLLKQQHNFDLLASNYYFLNASLAHIHSDLINSALNLNIGGQ